MKTCLSVTLIIWTTLCPTAACLADEPGQEGVSTQKGESLSESFREVDKFVGIKKFQALERLAIKANEKSAQEHPAKHVNELQMDSCGLLGWKPPSGIYLEPLIPRTVFDDPGVPVAFGYEPHGAGSAFFMKFVCLYGDQPVISYIRYYSEKPTPARRFQNVIGRSLGTTEQFRTNIGRPVTAYVFKVLAVEGDDGVLMYPTAHEVDDSDFTNLKVTLGKSEWERLKSDLMHTTSDKK